MEVVPTTSILRGRMGTVESFNAYTFHVMGLDAGSGVSIQASVSEKNHVCTIEKKRKYRLIFIELEEK